MSENINNSILTNLLQTDNETKSVKIIYNYTIKKDKKRTKSRLKRNIKML